MPTDIHTTYTYTNSNVYRVPKPPRAEEDLAGPCSCDPAEAGACCDERCINFSMGVECPLDRCPAGSTCRNQRIQKRQGAKVNVFDAGEKGHGVRVEQDCPKDTFLFEYVAEVIDEAEVKRRNRAIEGEVLTRKYFMSLYPGAFLDASRIGNEGRFMNHSCQCNSRVDKWEVDGEARMAVFANEYLAAGSEITIDYGWKYESGQRRTRCRCGSDACRGWIEQGADGVFQEAGDWRVPTDLEKSLTERQRLVGMRVKVFWEEYDGYYEGLVADVRDDGKHLVRYNNTEKWTALCEGLTNGATNASEAKALGATTDRPEIVPWYVWDTGATSVAVARRERQRAVESGPTGASPSLQTRRFRPIGSDPVTSSTFSAPAKDLAGAPAPGPPMRRERGLDSWQDHGKRIDKPKTSRMIIDGYTATCFQQADRKDEMISAAEQATRAAGVRIPCRLSLSIVGPAKASSLPYLSPQIQNLRDAIEARDPLEIELKCDFSNNVALRHLQLEIENLMSRLFMEERAAESVLLRRYEPPQEDGIDWYSFGLGKNVSPYSEAYLDMGHASTGASELILARIRKIGNGANASPSLQCHASVLSRRYVRLCREKRARQHEEVRSDILGVAALTLASRMVLCKEHAATNLTCDGVPRALRRYPEGFAYRTLFGKNKEDANHEALWVTRVRDAETSILHRLRLDVDYESPYQWLDKFAVDSTEEVKSRAVESLAKLEQIPLIADDVWLSATSEAICFAVLLEAEVSLAETISTSLRQSLLSCRIDGNELQRAVREVADVRESDTDGIWQVFCSEVGPHAFATPLLCAPLAQTQLVLTSTDLTDLKCVSRARDMPQTPRPWYFGTVPGDVPQKFTCQDISRMPVSGSGMLRVLLLAVECQDATLLNARKYDPRRPPRRSLGVADAVIPLLSHYRSLPRSIRGSLLRPLCLAECETSAAAMQSVSEPDARRGAGEALRAESGTGPAGESASGESSPQREAKTRTTFVCFEAVLFDFRYAETVTKGLWSASRGHGDGGRKPLPPQVLLRPLVEAVARVHASGHALGGLDPSSVFFRRNGHCRVLADATRPRFFRTDHPEKLRVDSVADAARLNYTAPEVLLSGRHGKAPSPAADVWSIGCLTATLLFGKPLMAAGSFKKQLEYIWRVAGAPEATTPREEQTTPGAPAAKRQRVGADGLLSAADQPLLKRFGPEKSCKPRIEKAARAAADKGGMVEPDGATVDFLERCLSVHPGLRPSAAELLEMPFLRAPQDAARAWHSLLRRLDAAGHRNSGEGLWCGDS